MKLFTFTTILATASACSTPLLVDSYANVTTTGTNAVGGFSSDDGTCTSLSSSNNTLTLVPGSSKCYYYTNFPTSKPEDAIGGGRGALQFSLVPPTAPWSFKINAKTWNGTNLIDSYTSPAGTTAGYQIVSLPITSFNGPDVPNLRNIRSFVIESFSDNKDAWEIGELLLTCAPKTTSSAAPAPTKKA